MPWTLGELRDIAAASWDKTANIMAVIIGLFDKTATAQKMNPYRQVAAPKYDAEEATERLVKLKGSLPKWQPPD